MLASGWVGGGWSLSPDASASIAAAAEVAIECTVPCFASTPISAFSPKWRAGRGSFPSAALSTLRDALASYGSHYPTLSPTTRQCWNNCGLASFIPRSHCTVPRFGPDKTLYPCLAPFERAINVLVDIEHGC